MVRGDVNGTNDSNSRNLGCSVMVAADYRGQTVMEFLRDFRSNSEVQQIIMRMFNNPGSSEVIEFFQRIGIQVHGEDLDDYTELLTGEGSWTGALGWPGHIIRARSRDGQLELWDPQGTLGEFLLPTNRPLQVYTFT
jgi:hypothetical protein